MEQIILGITLVAFVILMIVLLPNVPRQIIDGVSRYGRRGALSSA